MLKAPLRARSVPSRTASGSVVGPAGRAKTALASRIYVEGRHDANWWRRSGATTCATLGWSSSTSAASTTFLASWLTSPRETGGGSGCDVAGTPRSRIATPSRQDGRRFGWGRSRRRVKLPRIFLLTPDRRSLAITSRLY